MSKKITQGRELSSHDEIKSYFRDFKLKFLESKLDFNLNLNNENRNKISFIKEKLIKEDIITGSLALSILGFIDREVNDIDIIINDRNRYTGYLLNGYGDEELTLANRLGTKKFKHKRNHWSRIFSKETEYSVDFFENSGYKYLEVKTSLGIINVQSPFEIIDYKIKMINSPGIYISCSRKHNYDITNIFKRFL